MTTIVRAVHGWLTAWLDAWDRFWFRPQAPHTLALIRILAGAMMLYTQCVWALDLDAFLGRHSWVPASLVRDYHRESWTWSFLWHVESPALLWTIHLGTVFVFACLTIGLWTRVMSVLAWVTCLMYCHRLTGALYGLDQVNTMLAMYLMIGSSGAVWSVDRWRVRRRSATEPAPAIASNIAIRLMQLHLCVIYLFGGIGKMRGDLWWDGSALWYAAANYEYQSVDLTWIGHSPFLISLLTLLTLFWETFYPALVWPRLTRPFALGMAILVHGGIAVFMGMITFGVAMIIANLAFLDPATVQSGFEALAARIRGTRPEPPKSRRGAR